MVVPPVLLMLLQTLISNSKTTCMDDIKILRFLPKKKDIKDGPRSMHIYIVLPTWINKLLHKKDRMTCVLEKKTTM